jgi:sugar diacid utilization regulator
MRKTLGVRAAYDHAPNRGPSAPRFARSTNPALRTIAQRIAERKEELARRTVERYRTEIAGFQAADESGLGALIELALANIEALVSALDEGEPISEELLARAREAAARQSHQGVTLDALLHAARLWGETMWEAVLAAARADGPREREAALSIAGLIWRHVDVMSVAKASAYLDEVTDRGLVAHDLMSALLTGRGDDDDVQRLAHIARVHLAEHYVVVLIRPELPAIEDAGEQPLAARATLDRVVEAARTHLRPSTAPLLVGIRHGDVVALYPVDRRDDLDAVRRDCTILADGQAITVNIGMSGWHGGRSAIATAFAEAREAAHIANATGVHDRPVVLDDVLADHMLHASPLARRILADTLRPLTEYDLAHRTDLVGTLRAYLGANTNLTRSARVLVVHPNTVVYRLRRIKELSGRDPHVMDDLQVLFLALRLEDLSVPR